MVCHKFVLGNLSSNDTYYNNMQWIYLGMREGSRSYAWCKQFVGQRWLLVYRHLGL